MTLATLFKRSASGVFASHSLAGHLLRGAVAVPLVVWALQHQTDRPLGALLAGIVALIAFRGCPMCWTLGLVETLVQKGQGGPDGAGG